MSRMTGSASPTSFAIASRWPASAGPGSMIATVPAPTSHVSVPSSVMGDGFGASSRRSMGAARGSRARQRRSAMKTSASLSATISMASWSFAGKLSGSLLSMSIWPKISSPARISTTSSDFVRGLQAR